MKYYYFFIIAIPLLFFFGCPEKPVDFEELPNTGSIQGRVTNTSSVGINGATITTNPVTSTVTTSSAGNYTITNANPGNYSVTASLSGYVTNTTSVSVQAGQTATGNITLTASVTTGSITGKISNSSGTGLSGATVNTNPVTMTVSTDGEGNYTISNVNAGNYNLSASLIGYVTNTTSVTVQAGQTTTGDIILAAAVTTGSISGKISNSTGTGISGASVTTNPATTTVTTNSSGNYTISNVNTGNYTVSASSSGYVTNTINLNVQAGQTATGNITLATQTGGFTCGTSTVSYSGKTYNTVQIGSQCWLKENLNVGTRINGSQNPSNNGVVEKYCYNDNESNCNNYGGLYQWNEAMQYITTAGAMGICPESWHIPTESEYLSVKTYVNNDGNALKAIGQGNGIGAGTNTSGFSALLGGSGASGNYSGLAFDTYLITSSKSTNYPKYFKLESGNSYFLSGNGFTFSGFSLRCIKD